MKDPGAIAAAEALIACDPDVASATDLSEMSRNAAALRAFAAGWIKTHQPPHKT